MQESTKNTDDAGVKETLLALASTLRAVQRILEESVDESLKAMRRDFEASNRRLMRMEKKLEVVCKSVDGIDPKGDEIAQTIGIDKQNVRAGSSEEDRKRIKERLKEALEIIYERAKSKKNKQSFVEYFLGICKKNERVGRTGSRFGFNFTI